MVKHTEIIHQQQPPNCLSVFDQFVGLALKGFSKVFTWKILQNISHDNILFSHLIDFTNAKILNRDHPLSAYATIFQKFFFPDPSLRTKWMTKGA